MLKIRAAALCLFLAVSADVQAQQEGMLLPPGANVLPQQDAQHYIRTLRQLIGVIKYCGSSGHLTDAMAKEAVAHTQDTLLLITTGRNPTPEEAEAADAAEKMGAAGKVGPSMDIAERAKQMGTTPAQLCQDMHAKMAASILSAQDDEKRVIQEIYENVRNQIGITRYCGEHGHITPARAEVAGSLRKESPPEQTPAAIASADAAEMEGAAGKFGLSPPVIDLADMGPGAAAALCDTLVSGFAGETK
jgi:hypothetical protein